MKITVYLDLDTDGEPGDDDLNTDHRYPVEAHRYKRGRMRVRGEVHDVAVWLVSHYQGDLEDRLAPLRYAILVPEED